MNDEQFLTEICGILGRSARFRDVYCCYLTQDNTNNTKPAVRVWSSNRWDTDDLFLLVAGDGRLLIVSSDVPTNPIWGVINLNDPKSLTRRALREAIAAAHHARNVYFATAL